MCYTCGCKKPYDNHGDEKNLIENHLDEAGQTEAIEKKGKKSAKENMMELLRLQQEQGEIENPKEQY